MPHTSQGERVIPGLTLNSCRGFIWSSCVTIFRPVAGYQRRPRERSLRPLSRAYSLSRRARGAEYERRAFQALRVRPGECEPPTRGLEDPPEGLTWGASGTPAACRSRPLRTALSAHRHASPADLGTLRYSYEGVLLCQLRVGVKDDPFHSYRTKSTPPEGQHIASPGR